MDRAARVQEGEAVALEALHDEPLATEEPHADLFLECDTDETPFAAQRKASF